MITPQQLHGHHFMCADSQTLRKNLPAVELLCGILSERMALLRAVPCGVELHCDVVGEPDPSSQWQLIHLLAREDVADLAELRIQQPEIHKVIARDYDWIIERERMQSVNGGIFWDYYSCLEYIMQISPQSVGVYIIDPQKIDEAMAYVQDQRPSYTHAERIERVRHATRAMMRHLVVA